MSSLKKAGGKRAMKRLRYERPVLQSLNELQFATGRCKTGSNAVGEVNCESGGSASMECRVGNVADLGRKCWDGGSNNTSCKLGGAVG